MPHMGDRLVVKDIALSFIVHPGGTKKRSSEPMRNSDNTPSRKDN
jgi:hypothetical protein